MRGERFHFNPDTGTMRPATTDEIQTLERQHQEFERQLTADAQLRRDELLESVDPADRGSWGQPVSGENGDEED